MEKGYSELRSLAVPADSKKLGREPELRSLGDLAEGFGHTRLEGLCARQCDLLSERRQFLGLLG